MKVKKKSGRAAQDVLLHQEKKSPDRSMRCSMLQGGSLCLMVAGGHINAWPAKWIKEIARKCVFFPYERLVMGSRGLGLVGYVRAYTE